MKTILQSPHLRGNGLLELFKCQYEQCIGGIHFSTYLVQRFKLTYDL